MNFIKGSSIYYVTEDGNVHTIDMHGFDINGKKKSRKGRTLKPTLKRGYPCVTITYDDRSKRTRSVHRLVMETFYPDADHSLQVDHVNGIKTDNRLSNLEWVTPKENINRAYALGLNTKKEQDGEKNRMAKLKMKDVLHIITNLLDTHTDTEIGNMYGVSRRTINGIRNKQSWKTAYSLLEGQSTIEIEEDA